MTFEADLRAHLLADTAIAAALADQAANETRLYPVMRPRGQKTLPAVVYTVVAGMPQPQTFDEDDDSNAAGTGCENVRVQIDCYAADFDQATALGRLVIARMAKIASDKSIRATRLPRSSGQDPESREAREMLEFSVWHTPQ
jgi:hypothetical protein